MITLFKQRGSITTASHISLDELVQMIREQKYGRELATYREVWPLQKVSRMDDDKFGLELCVEEPKSVPRVCVAAEWQKREGVMKLMGYNGLIMLEVNNLEDTDSAIALRYFAGRQPQTLLSFIGADGRSVVIICQAAELPRQGSKAFGSSNAAAQRSSSSMSRCDVQDAAEPSANAATQRSSSSMSRCDVQDSFTPTGLNPLNPSKAGLNPLNPSKAGLYPLNPSEAGLNPLNPSKAGLNPLNPSEAGLNLTGADLNQEKLVFHRNAYAKAQKFYTAQLEVTVDMLEPRLDRTCLVSADAGLCYNPDAIPFYADAEETFELPSPYQPTQANADLLPGHTLAQTHHHLVQYCLRKAFEDCSHLDDEDEYRVAVLTRHAQYCMESGVPKAVALRLTLFWPNLGRDALLAETIFDNAYTPAAMRRQLKRADHEGVSLRHLPESTLLMLRTNVFMEQNYEFRKNVLTGVAQYRELSKLDFDFLDVTEEVRNSMTTKALLAGLKSWDKDIKRYIESKDIPQYDPIEDYLTHLPAWDGRDRLVSFAQRVPTDDPLWPRFFPLWMRSMVAHWQGKDRTHGNALMPLLIGPQGCGKSTFCGIVLPPELLPYYNDRVNFKNEYDLLNQLSSFALINIDEFDSIGNSRQPLLKYLLSKPDVKLRVPYGKSISSRRRYASFIATTNQQMPLTDPTGARRFLCVNVTGRIDTDSPVDYTQLYAQLVAEIRGGMRYWLTDEETAEVIAHNERFRQLDSIDEMVRSLYRKPEEGEECGMVLTATIVEKLHKKYGLPVTHGLSIKVGNVLSAMHCEGNHSSKGAIWKVLSIENV